MLIVVVSIGLAVLVSLGFVRIFYNIPLYKFLFVTYLVIGVLALFVSKEYMAIAFDASGATTGVISVPFILALSVGISSLKRDGKESEEDSFGLVAIASSGAIVSVLILGIFNKSDAFNPEVQASTQVEESFFTPYLNVFGDSLNESILGLAPLILILIIMQIFFLKMSKKSFFRMIKGFVCAFIGMLLFMLGVNGGFMEVGVEIGKKLSALDSNIPLLVVAFVLGVATILAEPAIYVLTQQIEEVTSGYVKKSAVLLPLTIGVGLAVVLSIIRMLVPAIELWHYLLPGYIISIILMFIVPKLFVGIAFDSGGVATGPMSATFIFAFVQGAAQGIEGADVMVEGFGMIAMVALMPVITLQILGLIFKIKTIRKEKQLKEGANV